MNKITLAGAVRSLAERVDLNLRLESPPEYLETTFLSFGADNYDQDKGQDLVYGLSGDDIIDVRTTVGLDDEAPFYDEDIVYGGRGNDEIMTGVETDLVYGGTGDDWIKTGMGDDIIAAGDGDDRINGGHGSDQIWTGEGEDVVVIHGTSAVDKIMDFESGEDILAISQDWFDFNDVEIPEIGQLGTDGNLQFGHDGTTNAQFYLVQNGLAPVLVYDEDGAGAGEALAVVRLTLGDTIAESDIFILG